MILVENESSLEKHSQSISSLRNPCQYKELGREHGRDERSKEVSLIPVCRMDGEANLGSFNYCLTSRLWDQQLYSAIRNREVNAVIMALQRTLAFIRLPLCLMAHRNVTK